MYFIVNTQSQAIEGTATKDLINGCIGWQSTVEDSKLPLQSLWDVVSPTTRVDHCSQYLYICNSNEVSWFVQAVHAVHFHHLADYLIGYLLNNHIQDLFGMN